jgi:hypothetical protein
MTQQLQIGDTVLITAGGADPFYRSKVAVVLGSDTQINGKSIGSDGRFWIETLGEHRFQVVAYLDELTYIESGRYDLLPEGNSIKRAKEIENGRIYSNEGQNVS